MPQFADISGLPKSWLKQLRRWEVSVIENYNEDSPSWGGEYNPDLRAIIFYEPWTLETLAHEFLHAAHAGYGRLTELTFPPAFIDKLRELGYTEDRLEEEAEAYLLQSQPKVVLKIMSSLEPA